MSYRSRNGLVLLVFIHSLLIPIEAATGPVSKLTRSLGDTKVAGDVFELFDSRIASYTNRYAKNVSNKLYPYNEAKRGALVSALKGKNKKEISQIAAVFRRNPSVLSNLPKSDLPAAVQLISKASARDIENARKGTKTYNSFYIVKSINVLGWKKIKAHGLDTEANIDVLIESGKLVVPGKKSSWFDFRQSMRNADMSGRKYDWAEHVYLTRAKQGREETIKKGAIEVAQRNKIHGIDFISIEKGRIRVIEFSMGSKPSIDNPQQMSEAWVKRNLERFIGGLSGNDKERLISKGFPEELLSNPKKLRYSTLDDLNISREFHAMEKNNNLLRKMDQNIRFVCLKKSPKCN